MKKKISLVNIVLNLVLAVSLSMCGMTMTGCSGLPVLSQPLPNSPQNRPPVPTDPNLVLIQMMQQQSLNAAMSNWAGKGGNQGQLQAQINEQRKQITALIMNMSPKKESVKDVSGSSGMCKPKAQDPIFAGYNTNFQYE